jgi:hypothetical protein
MMYFVGRGLKGGVVAFLTEEESFGHGRSMRDLLTDSDESSFVWRKFLQSLLDHGGEIKHLNRLLADTRNTRSIIDRWAKLVIGQIWELAENQIDLRMCHDGGEEDDFDCTAEKFLSRYAGPVKSSEIRMYSETKPKSRCKYQLHHFPKPMLSREVVEAFEQGGTLEHASWRELHVYMHWIEDRRLLSPIDLHGCHILAGGSTFITHAEDDGPKSFFSANALFGKEFNIFPYQAALPRGFKIEPTCFFLVRVYEE